MHSGLIWLPSHEEDDDSGTTYFDSTHNTIHWLCQTGSPCNDVATVFPYSPHIYFLVEVSSAGVDGDSSYCAYRSRYLLRIYGLELVFRRALSITALTMAVCLGTPLLFFPLFWWRRRKAREGQVHPETDSAVDLTRHASLQALRIREQARIRDMVAQKAAAAAGTRGMANRDDAISMSGSASGSAGGSLD